MFRRWNFSVLFLFAVLLFAVLLPSALVCAQNTPLNNTRVIEPVSLSNGTYTITHWQYDTNPDNTLASVDYNTLATTTFNALILENQFLRVTVVPEFGARIVSVFNKVTQNEELFQNPVGSPYLNNTNTFYYNWLMVLGGIFPTFPESEHGKTWLLPWEVEILENNDQTVSIQMRFQDTIDFERAPRQFTYGVTNLRCSYTVTLQAGRTALETEVLLENPTNNTVNFEYWTNTAFAPGSNPSNTFLNNSYQMIADINQLQPRLGGFGASFGLLNDGSSAPLDWDFVQFFSNHQTFGTQYPEPNIANSNFWGGINQNNREGFFRIADNTLTPGLKIFSFGFDNTLGIDPAGPTDNNFNWQRPAIEMWAGTSNVFFEPDQIEPQSTLRIPATYSPSVGMINVTNASDDVLVNLTPNALELFFMTPVQNYRVVALSNNTVIVDQVVQPNPQAANRILGDFDGLTSLRILNEANDVVFDQD